MPNPSKQIVAIVVLGIAVAVGGFQTGRRTVDADAITASVRANSERISATVSPSYKSLPPPEQSQTILRDIATVPFSELYDVLKSASREQLLAWARALEKMPRGPRQRAAVTAYYKSLIQVDHRAAIEAVLQAENLLMRDLAIDALTKAAPESTWADLAEMGAKLPHPRRNGPREDVIWNWSCVDPAAVSRFIENHPVPGKDDGRLFSLLCHWGDLDPIAARKWVEDDASRQTKDAFRGLVTSWAEVDPAAAINYAVANAERPDFDEAIKELSYQFVRLTPDDARKLILLLPPEKAKMAMENIARTTTGIILHVPEDYQRPPDVIARWMVSFPSELWKDNIGGVVAGWIKSDASAATSWLDQLQPSLRDATIVSFCHAAESESAPAAITLGLTITDPNARADALGRLARALAETRDEAIKAVNELPISPQQKSYLLKVMPETAN
jgi:hypothetical protein